MPVDAVTIEAQSDASAAKQAEGEVRGAPVEAAVEADGTHAYVSNHNMYGPGWHPVATDQISSVVDRG